MSEEHFLFSFNSSITETAAFEPGLPNYRDQASEKSNWHSNKYIRLAIYFAVRNAYAIVSPPIHAY